MSNMIHHSRTRSLLLAAALAFGVLALAVQFSGTSPASGAVYLGLMLLPGLGIHLLVDRTPRLLEAALSAFALSPVLVGACGALFLLTGLSPAAAAWLFVLGTVALTAVVGFRQPRILAHPVTQRQYVVLAATIAIFCALAGYLPLRYEWWRLWSDAWFHSAIIQQIDAYGIPPEDPYFVGLDLQYMWIYHVAVLIVHHATGIDPMLVMPLFNLNALVGFALGAYLLSTRLRARFAHGVYGVLFVMLALNAAVWAFLPLRALRALIGTVRGWHEVAHSFTLVPFDHARVWAFLDVYFNQPFLLNKFIVSTAFSIGLCLMASFWFFAVAGLAQDRRRYLLLASLSMIGMTAFHVAVGFMMAGGICGGAVAVFIFRNHIRDFSRRAVLGVVAVTLGSIAVCLPYIYAVSHLKRSEQFVPVSLTLQKSGGLLIACALVIALAVKPLLRLWRTRTLESAFVVMTTLALFAVCNLIALPGPNTYDKPPFIVFFPLAVVASWTLADRLTRPAATPRYRRKIALVTALVLVPVNLLALLGYANTPRPPWVSPDEHAMASWIAANTHRDAILFESGNRTVFIVKAPRRFYIADSRYAEGWGYPLDEVARRLQVREDIYSDGALGRATLSTLAEMPTEVYLVVREDDPASRTAERLQAEGLTTFVHRSGRIALFEVDREACRRAVERADPPRGGSESG